MKIGLLTYFWQDNPGQYYQALATMEALQNKFKGARVEIVNFCHEDTFWRPSMRLNKIFQSIISHQAYVKARSRLNLSQDKLVTKDRHKVFDYIERQEYDFLVVGSDVVLKMLPTIIGDQLPAYWLSSRLKMPKFLLASSADTTRADDLTEQQRDAIRESIECFSMLAVRDTMTWNLLTELGVSKNDSRLMRVSDPTFPYIVQKYSQPHCLDKRHSVSKPICAIHLSRNIFTDELVNLLKASYHVVVIGGPMWPGLRWWGGGPSEWCDNFNHLDLVVTVSFHESIFAVKNNVPVVAVDAEEKRIDLKSGLSKTFCLMQDLGLEDCHINPHKGISAKTAYDHVLNVFETFNGRCIANKVEDCAHTYNSALDRIEVTVSKCL